MTARSHADRGQLFGWDGQTMWIEQTLDASEHHYICKRCGAASPAGVGYVSETPGPSIPAATCPEPHLYP